jgi:hypothetical protein
MTRKTLIAIAGAAVAGLAAVAVAGRAPASPGTRAAARLSITATNYAFSAPDTFAAGLTQIDLLNRGPELHHVTLVRLEPGKTGIDFFAALRRGGPLPAWAHEVGGPNAPAPEMQTSALVNLETGHYVLICLIPASDGIPHFMKGMFHDLTVVPARATSTVSVASPDVAISLRDYDFILSKSLTPGRHIIRVTNDGPQTHEMVLFRIASGRTAAEVAAWAEKPQGPPPGLPIGGTTDLEPRAFDDIITDLSPGEYGLVCYVPDAKDGKRHWMHGMIKQFTVK